ncbi:molybdenum cofactor guanylyltransferase [Clostridium sp. NSJ-6]|uniref:Probable molybdenum cofactor guanylyltransferase n=1 Tax=Clostridium hominis TaxID=2763036 RepID=A0ABR7DCB0_9CLOT|nr:molybdenum cofactor guanylyltransferase [Clostridium hominis]MBC5628993.1 molybdenum cofactor guanylyltransferase [Clostridium hominis]MDU2671947.1 molybdenum cofactor guanylyltransferase [Clostridium sp.]
MINKTLAILAGGKSSRMNYNNKAFLSFKEKTFIEHIINAGKSFKEIIIVANDKEVYERFNLRVVEDIYKGNGPLAGIHSALKSSNTDYVLCVACDMPLVSSELLDFLGNYNEDYEILVPKYKERLQPLCSIYSKNIIGKIEESLIRNENKLQRFIMSSNYKVIEELDNRKFEEEDFLNVNTPIEFNELEER